MQVTEVDNLDFRDRSAVVFDVDQVPSTHEELSESLPDLPLRQLLGAAAIGLPELQAQGTSYDKVRDLAHGKSIDWWAGDFLWHVDGTRWPVQPVYTVMACRQAYKEAPGSELLDTVKLYEQTIEDGFWERHGMEESELKNLVSVFVDSTYYREAMPFMRSLASPEDAALIDQRLAQDLAESKSETFEEFIAKNELKRPAKSFPTLRRTALHGLYSLFFDGGGRNASLVGPNGEDHTAALHDLRLEYLTGEQPYDRDLVRSVGWTANRCVIFPQIGTLHRAQPGNERYRNLAVAFLSENPTEQAA